VAIEFRILGTVEAQIDGAMLDVGSARQRSVLAALLAETNQVVSADQLANRVWGDRVPLGARPTLRSYLSRLRQVIAGAENAEIARRTGGYVLTINPSALDLNQFRELVAKARAAEDRDQALDLLDRAVGVWRGEALTGLDSPWLNALRDTIEAERVAAELERVDLQLHRGQHNVVLAELTNMVVSRPLDERVAAQFMLALYRGGRQADALAHYGQIRLRLADELGADPTPALRQLHRQILTADPALAIPTTARSTSPPVPRQLPQAPASFTGRREELDQLSGALDNADGTVVITVVGAGGIGKTWLTLHWAHRTADRFPDGQLFVDLQGYAPADKPVPPAVAVRGFLDALGVQPAQIPAHLDAQVGLYRSLVAGRRMLIMLDNARDAHQVMPLLPGSPTCTVVVTSRDRMARLVVTHDAHPLALDVLPESTARALLVRRLGHARVHAEPEALADMLTYCAGLPLALGIAAGRAATHQDFPLATWAAELRDAATRLDALDDGDPATSLSTVLSWSTSGLNPQQAHMFQLLGLAPGPSIGVAAAASLTAHSIATTRSLLRGLDRVTLVDEVVPGRWQMHDLIRLHAANQAGRDHPEAMRNSALRRLVDYYIHTAVAADRLLAPHRARIELDSPAAGCQPGSPPDESAALAWFTTEHACLLAAQRLAVERGWHAAVWQLAWALDTVHSRRGDVRDRLATWQPVCTIAHHLEPTAQILTYRTIGRAYANEGQHAQAIAQLRRAFTLAEDIGDLPNQAHTHQAFAWAWARYGDHRRALEHSTKARNTFRALNSPQREARALNSMGWYATRLGYHDQARSHGETALALFRNHNDRTGEADALDSLGLLAQHTNHHAEAIFHYEQALTVYRDTGDTAHEADTLARLGECHRARNHHTKARDSWQQALHLYQAQNRADGTAHIQDQLKACPPTAAE
jgi:DNA-binding SARP family transcriptional activator/tetratricopeptide (TPR) repeat protein